MMNKCFGLLFAAVLICGAAPIKTKLSTELETVDALSSVKVIIQWKTAPNSATHAKVSSWGGVLHSVHTSIKAAAYTVPASALSELAKDPEVAYISLDRPLTAKLDYTAAAVNASYLWAQNFDGTGIGVAVIDSGMKATPDLTRNNRIVYNQDFTGEFKPNANLTDTNNAPDLFGHGEHVAGIIASSGQTSSCGNCTRALKGISPGVSLINLRVLNENGVGTDSMVIAAIEKAIALKNTYNIRVINLSLGRPVYESYTLDPLCQAVEKAWKAGIVVVVAAGNDGRDNSFGTQGYGTITAPGNDPYVITVGGMKTGGTYSRTDDLIASYSSKGPTQVDHVVKPDVVAPGNQVVSLLASNTYLVKQYPANNVPVSYYQDPNNHGASNVYYTLSGTSMASPAVSGGVADLLQAKPSLTPDQVKALIMQTAYKTFPTSSTAIDPVSGQSFVDYYDIFTVGAGYLDLQAALQNINTVPTGGTALSPVALYDNSTGIVTLSLDPATVWGNQSLWGAKSLWGAQRSGVLPFSTAAINASGERSLSGARSLRRARNLFGARTLPTSQSTVNDRSL